MPWTKKQARFFETKTAEKKIPRKTLAKMRHETHDQFRGRPGGFGKPGASMRELHRAAHKS